MSVDLQSDSGPDAPTSTASNEAHDAQLTATIARGGLWSLAGQASGLVVALFATPFTIRLLGPARYGLWALLQSSLSWLGLADFGMSAASTTLAAERHAQGDDAGEARATWTAALITIVATSGVAIAAGVAAPFLVTALLHVRHPLARSAELAVRLIAAASVATVIMGTLGTPLVVRQRWKANTLITSGTSIIYVALIPLALAVLGGGLYTAAIIYLGCALLSAAVMVWYAGRLQPELRRPRFVPHVARRLIVFGAALTVSGIASVVLTSAERILLGHYKSAAAVGYYAVAARLGTLLWVIPMSTTQPLLPAFVTLNGRGEIAQARALYRRALQASFLVLTPLTLLLGFLARPFLTFWAGSRYGQYSTVPFFVVLIGVWFNAIAWLPVTYLTAVSRPSLLARVHTLELVPYIAAAALLTTRFGALGAAAVWTGRVVVDALVFCWVASRTESLTLSPLPDQAMRSLTLCALFAGALAVLTTTTASLMLRSVYALALVPPYCLASWRFVLTSQERRGLRSLGLIISPLRRLRPSRQP